jgi:hypothetical protein
MEQATLIEVKNDEQTLVLIDGWKGIERGPWRHYNCNSLAADHATGDLGDRQRSSFRPLRQSPWDQ